MAQPVTSRSRNNLILEGATDLINTLLTSIKGTDCTGKIVVTNGNVAVTGVSTDTSFTTQLTEGQWITLKPDRTGHGAFGQIDTIITDQSLTLVNAWTGEDKTDNYVTFTNDQYLEANEYPALVDFRLYDSQRPYSPNFPSGEFYFHDEEPTDREANALGTMGLVIVTHRANFLLMQQESLEIAYDVIRWLQVQRSNKAIWDDIAYSGFEPPMPFTDERTREERLAVVYYFRLAYRKDAI